MTFRSRPHEVARAPLLIPPSFADGLFWSSVACCVFAQFHILRSVGGRRHAPLPAALANLPRRRGAMEVLWAVVPAAGLAVLLVFTWMAIQTTPDRPRPSAPLTETGR